MLDLSKYKWIDKKIKNPNIEFDKTDKVLTYLDMSDLSVGKRNLILKYYFYELERYANENRLSSFKISDDISKDIQSWQKSKAYKKMRDTVSEDESKFYMDSLISYCAFYFIIFYTKEILTGDGLISWWLLSMIVCLSVYFLFRNYRDKYFFLIRYGLFKQIMTIDLVGAAVAIVIEIAITLSLDPNIIVLLLVYFLTKNKAKKCLENFDKKVEK